MKFVSGIFATTVFILAESSYAQGSFVNLDFEGARIFLDSTSPYYPHAASLPRALPGWSFNGFLPGFFDIFYNSGTAGSAAVSIHDTNTAAVGSVQILQGRYSMFLQGEFTALTNAASVSLWQTGQIPVDTQSLTFWGQLQSLGLHVSFNGQTIPFTALGNGVNYTIYGADISAFAGQTGELRFTQIPRTESVLDNIQFSSSSIPEPSSLTIIGAGTLLVRLFRRRNSPR